MMIFKVCILFSMLVSFTTFGGEKQNICLENPDYACLEPYVQETRNLYAEYKNAHRIFYGIFDMAENADTIHSLVEISTLLAAGGATGLASGGVLPMAFIGAAMTYHTTSAIIDLTHKKRCAELCTSKLAEEEKVKFETPDENYVAFMMKSHSSKFQDLKHNENFSGKLEDRFKRVKKRWTPESLKIWWNNMGRAENQGLKCLTTCSISQGQGITQKVVYSAEFKTSYGYTCKMLDVLPLEIGSLMRFAQILLLEHHFVKHRDEVNSSRLTKFLNVTEYGELCNIQNDNFKKKINILKTFHDILGKPPKVPVFTPKRILQKIFGKPCLHQSAEKEDVGKLDACLKKEKNVETRDALGKTALHQAAKYGNIEAAKFLYFKNADLGTKDDRGYTPLHQAAQNNRPEMIDLLVRMEVDINPIDNEGKTPLHLASENGHISSIQKLLEFNAFSSIQDYKGNTPLHLAFKAGKDSAINELYKFPNVSAQDIDGNTVLHLAAQKQNETFVRHFVRMGADIQLENNAKKTALNLAKDPTGMLKMPVKKNHTYDFLERHLNLLKASQEKDDIKSVKKLFEDPFLNPNVREKNGKTPLMFGAKMGFSKIVEFLLSKPRIQVNLQDDNGKTALHFAVENNNLEITKLILKNTNNKKSDLKIQDEKGNTAIHLAVQNNQKDITRSLLEHIPAEDKKEIFEIINEEEKTVFDLNPIDDIKKILCTFYSKLPNSEQLQTCK